MATRKEKITFTIERLRGFLLNFTRSKRGMIGLMVLVIFSSLAIAAPLLTPHNPSTSKWLAGKGTAYHARPAWYRYFPGGGNLSENLEPVADAGFTTPASLDQFIFDITPQSSSNIITQHVATMGSTPTGLGSLAVTYKRKAYETLTEAKVTLTKQFYFPFTGPPAQFSCSISVLTEGAEEVPVEIKVFIDRAWVKGDVNGDLEIDTLDIELLTASLGSGPGDSEWNSQADLNKDNIINASDLELAESNLGERKRYEWGMGSGLAMKTFEASLSKWIKPSPPIITTLLSPTDLEKVIFSEVGNYTYGAEITFKDKYAEKNVEATVYVDDFSIKLFGTAFGLLGNDFCGRDVFTQLVYGARISMIVGLLSAVLSIGIGLILGLVSAYIGGLADELLMRITDMLLVLPGLPLLIVFIAVLGPSILNLIMLIGLLGWMGFARLVRSQVLSLKERAYVEAAKAIGSSRSHIMMKHIIPNVMGLVWVSLALSVPAAITAEAALAWLGFYDPYIMSWGRMLYDVQNNGGFMDWWWVVPPGICLALVSVSFILLGYALDEILNPRLRLRR